MVHGRHALRQLLNVSRHVKSQHCSVVFSAFSVYIRCHRITNVYRIDRAQGKALADIERSTLFLRRSVYMNTLQPTGKIIVPIFQTGYLKPNAPSQITSQACRLHFHMDRMH